MSKEGVSQGKGQRLETWQMYKPQSLSPAQSRGKGRGPGPSAKVARSRPSAE